MTHVATHATDTVFSVTRTRPEWTLSYPGFRISGRYNVSKTLFILSITPPAVCDVPSFKLSIPTPLPSRTWVLLPGSTTLLEMSYLQEISVVSMDSIPSIHGREAFFDRLNPWFRRVIENDGYVTVIREAAKSDTEYCVQASCGFCEEIDEAFIVLSCYKYVPDDGGSTPSATSESGYERFLEGL